MVTLNSRLNEVELRKFNRAEIIPFTEAAIPRAEEVLKNFAMVAQDVDSSLFNLQIIHALVVDEYTKGSKLVLRRVLDIPKLMYLSFDLRFLGSGSSFYWFDRYWFEQNRHLLSRAHGSAVSDGGINCYLDPRGFYNYCHVLLKKYGYGSIEIYRGTIDKKLLAEAIIVEYVINNASEDTLDVEQFVNYLAELLDQHLPEERQSLSGPA